MASHRYIFRNPGTLSRNEVQMLIELADDLAYGITAIRFARNMLKLKKF